MPTDPRFWSEVLLQTLTLFVLLVGLLGLLIPVFPALVVMWLATFIYALIENSLGRMGWIDWTLFGLITILMLVGSVIDNIIIARKMRGRSIPWSSIAPGVSGGHSRQHIPHTPDRDGGLASQPFRGGISPLARSQPGVHLCQNLYDRLGLVFCGCIWRRRSDDPRLVGLGIVLGSGAGDNSKLVNTRGSRRPSL